MVTRRTMTISRFVLGAQPTAQQQPPQGHDQTPPSSSTNRTRKRPHTAEQTPAGSGDVSTRTPSRSSGNIVIREPAAQTGMNVASTSRATSAWQPSFLLDGKPLPATASVRVWEKGERGCVAQILVHDLLLPEDVHTFEDGTDESLGRRLHWHTIAVIPCSLFFLFFNIYIDFYTRTVLVVVLIIVVLLGCPTDPHPRWTGEGAS